MPELITIELLRNLPEKEYLAIARNEIMTKIIVHNRQFALLRI